MQAPADGQAPLQPTASVGSGRAPSRRTSRVSSFNEAASRSRASGVRFREASRISMTSTSSANSGVRRVTAGCSSASADANRAQHTGTSSVNLRRCVMSRHHSSLWVIYLMLSKWPPSAAGVWTDELHTVEVQLLGTLLRLAPRNTYQHDGESSHCLQIAATPWLPPLLGKLMQLNCPLPWMLTGRGAEAEAQAVPVARWLQGSAPAGVSLLQRQGIR